MAIKLVFTRLYVFLLVFSVVGSSVPIGGWQGLRTKQAIYEDVKDSQWMSLTLHKQIVDSNGHVTGKGPALNTADPNLTFHTGDKAVLSYKASFDSYIYVVNVSADGTTLFFPQNTASNTLIPANTVRDFTFHLAGAAGQEDFIAIVSRAKIDNPKLNNVISSPATQKKLPNPTTPLPPIQTSSTPDSKSAQTQSPSTGPAVDSDKKKCGLGCVLKTIGTTVGSIAATAFVPWLGPFFNVASAGASTSGTRVKSAVFESASDNNEIFAIADPNSKGGTDLKDSLLVLRVSFNHV